jgi:hypothetical protein
VPVLKYAKVLLLTPAIGSVLICFVGLSLGGVLLATWGRSSHEMAVKPVRPAAVSNSAPVASTVSRPGRESDSLQAQLLTSQPVTSHPALVRINARGRSSQPRLKRAIFEKALSSDQLEFLNDYSGRPANDVVREQKLRRLVDMVVPYAPFHFGLDVPLPQAVEGMLSKSTMPVEIREGRYVMVSGRRGENARGRAFLWIDMQEGIALGGIFFYPSNGEPTPTLTLFSKQVKDGSLGMSQLPVAFAQDLSRWAAAGGVPPITTRYFINASSEKILLAHDEDFCRNGGGLSGSRENGCEQMNAEAADIDLKATHFLQQTQFASNATMRMIAEQSNGDGKVVR